MSMVNLLAGDVGGTNTRLGLFEKTPSRPRLVAARDFTTLDFADLPSMITAFLRAESLTDVPIASACVGVAGPVMGDTASLTNIPWRVDAHDVARAFGLSHVRLLNDLEAMAYAVPVLNASEIHVLQQGQPARGAGNIAVIAAGTGLGEALLHHVDDVRRRCDGSGTRRLRRAHRARDRPAAPSRWTLRARAGRRCRVGPWPARHPSRCSHRRFRPPIACGGDRSRRGGCARVDFHGRARTPLSRLRRVAEPARRGVRRRAGNLALPFDGNRRRVRRAHRAENLTALTRRFLRQRVPRQSAVESMLGAMPVR